jgi:ankyrin repeat protein
MGILWNDKLRKTMNELEPMRLKIEAHKKLYPGIDLIRAIRDHYFDEVKRLIESGVDANEENDYGNIPLHIGIEKDCVDIVEYLLQNGANVNAKEELLHRTPLIYAASQGRKEIVTLLLKYGADPHEKDDVDFTALTWATKKGHAEIVELLTN